MDTYEIDESYSLAVYHFNLQYVAGNVKTYHHLHRRSMRPFLRFFERHPSWCASCELQGHYLKFMQRHYPADLALLRKLNQRDQIEIISVHYSDQIYLAYPHRDLHESIQINDEIFHELGLTRSNVWFGQENFFGPGIAEKIMPAHGYRTALLQGHYIWHHKHDAQGNAPYWQFQNLDPAVVHYLNSSGQSYDDGKIRINQRFSYWGDAELAFGATPYAAFLAKPLVQYQKHYEKYRSLEKQGIKAVKVSDYIKRVEELKLKPAQGPHITDASWNTRYYCGTYLWMGYYRLPWEKDADLRTLTFQTRANLLTIEQFVQWAKKKGIKNPEKLDYLMKKAWKHQLLAEVSDSTGQQPAPIEIKYTQAECEACERCLLSIENLIKSQLQLPERCIDTFNQDFSSEICEHEDIGKSVRLNVIKNWFPEHIFTLRIPKTRLQFNISVANDEFGVDERHYILNLVAKPRYTPLFKRIFAFFREGRKSPSFAHLFDTKLGNSAGIAFPMWASKLIYSPSCMDDSIISLDKQEFDFDRTWLPLPNGLIGVGNETYIIKHNSYGNTHIACTLNFEETPPTAGFFVLNPPRGLILNWQFSIFRGSEEEALRIANRINVFPTRKL